ncbi:DNA mismatch repair endonuclease MutL [Methanoregula sp.]|uniref:DNA mismatch repair endonuclease MutL n=1 Tax=Methanoregula sp. TaxID=2052170 RepID=UPI0025FD6DC0|nr:DNA mismatch repair endonuclease MutL [Methanoregula sp.]
MTQEWAGGRTIRVLDPATVNQIAAGEVVERPASVVKELVENAIDAGARTIRIDITSVQGGIVAIRVTDDGCGMSPADAELAFTPHATSKLTTIDDLFKIHTLGFRGEALASIAAVAKVTLVTKPRGSTTVAGTRLVVIGGVQKEKGETGVPEGTSVLVEELFFNTPARKKFQKNLNTELARIHGILEGIFLANPQVSFRFYHNNREQLVTDRTTQPLDTIARIFGNECARELIPVSSDLPFMRISGFISRPALSRKDHDRILIAINDRYVSTAAVTAAVKEGYGTLLPRDRFPVALLLLAIDTRLVDVNVHPTKKQVRLSKEKEIVEAVREAVHSALSKNDLIPEVVVPRQQNRELESAGIAAARTSSGVAEPAVPYGAGARGLPAAATPDPGAAIAPALTEPTHTGTVLTDHRLRQTELASGVPPVTAVVPSMEVIGQVGGCYILAAAADGELIIIDQHAAHERIFYEQVSRSMTARHAQELLVPAIIHRPPKDAAILRELIPVLAEEGVVIEEFGSGSFLVRAVPAVMGTCEGPAMIDDLVSDLMSSDPTRPVSDRERITRIIACRSAIKAGTVCTLEQCQRIVNQLRATQSPFTCPHGRPTMVRFSRAKLDEMFKRT